MKKADEKPFEYQGRYYQKYEPMTREEWPCLNCKMLHGDDLAGMPDKWLETPNFTEIDGFAYCAACATHHEVSTGVRDEWGDIKKQ